MLEKKPMPRFHFFVIGCLWWLMLLPGIAQEPAKEEEKDTTTVEEMVVTARKKEEKLQDIPLSVTAFSAKTIEEASITDIADVADLTPGFSFETAFGRQADRPVIRGMSNILGAANASVFIDGVYVAGSIQATELDNIDRVEVVKGPQSALYGRATFAGAINYITRRPSNQFQGQFSATLAEHDEYVISFNHSGPIVRDSLLYSVSARSYEYGGEYNNTVTDETIGGEESLGFSGSLTYLGSAFDATFRLAYSEDDDEHFAIALQDSTFNNCFLDNRRQYYCGVVNTFDSVSLNTDSLEARGISGLERETLRASLTMNFQAGNNTISTLTAYNAEELANGIDQDFTGQEPFRGSFQTVGRTDFNDFAQEIRIASPATDRISWLAGAYYFDQENEDDPLDDRPPAADLLVENIAVFGMVSGQISDKVRLSGELRVQEDTIRVEGGANNENFEETYDSVNPRAILEVDASDNALFYANIARGNKPGGINRDADLPAELQAIDEETSVNYELGLKTSAANNRIFWNIAGYYIDWTKQQLTTTFQFVDPDTGDPQTISYLTNAGETEVLGIETEITAQATENWQVQAAYSYNNAEFTQYESADQEALTGDASVVGNTTPRSPENMFNVSNTFRGRLNDSMNWMVRGDVIYEDSRFAQIHNFAETGSSTRVNLRGTLDFNSFRLSLWVKNLTDEDAANSVLRYVDANRFGPPTFTFLRSFAVTLPRGRQVGFSGSVRF